MLYLLILFLVVPARMCVAFHSIMPHAHISSKRKLMMNGDGTAKQSDSQSAESVCLIVASADGMLPSSKSSLPAEVQRPPNILEKLNLIYHSASLVETRKLEYLQKENGKEASEEKEERILLALLRTSLEDAGFLQLTQRDLDLCEALNAGYLLRLSIQPDVSDLDPSLAAEFYPERVATNETSSSNLLFDGRVLIFRRGYSSETTSGRLLLPKLDYLQASLVQGSAYKVTQNLRKFEHAVENGIERVTLCWRMRIRAMLYRFSEVLPTKPLKRFLQSNLNWQRMTYSELKHVIRKSKEKGNGFLRLGRYGGSQVRFVGNPSPNDALSPFLVCETGRDKVFGASRLTEKNGDITRIVYDHLNHDGLSCEYDREYQMTYHNGPMPSKLLKRVSIGNIVDVFSAAGRKRMVTDFFSKADLVEPTYGEVVVIWRPRPKKAKKVRKIRLPKAIYDAAEIFDMEHKLPEMPIPNVEPRPRKLEVRAFSSVPMANLPGVFPKTRLVFRPADAFLFDLISVFTLLLVLGAQQFDSPRLDFLALISVSLWIIRTLLRYSNKLARYDLLVKKFLTSKIAHRDEGAIKYIADEAASQKAIRAAIVHVWLLMHPDVKSMAHDELLDQAYIGINDMLQDDQHADLDIEAGLKDLEILGLISFNEFGDRLDWIADEKSAVAILKSSWTNVFEGKLSGVVIRESLRT